MAVENIRLESLEKQKTRALQDLVAEMREIRRELKQISIEIADLKGNPTEKKKGDGEN